MMQNGRVDKTLVDRRNHPNRFCRSRTSLLKEWRRENVLIYMHAWTQLAHSTDGRTLTYQIFRSTSSTGTLVL